MVRIKVILKNNKKNNWLKDIEFNETLDWAKIQKRLSSSLLVSFIS